MSLSAGRRHIPADCGCDGNHRLCRGAWTSVGLAARPQRPVRVTFSAVGDSHSCAVAGAVDGEHPVAGDQRQGTEDDNCASAGTSAAVKPVSLRRGISCVLRDGGVRSSMAGATTTGARPTRLTAGSCRSRRAATSRAACGPTARVECWGRSFTGGEASRRSRSARSTPVAAIRAGCAPTARSIAGGANQLRSQIDAPEGKFLSLSTGWDHSCAVRVDGNIECWGRRFATRLDAPAGAFSAVATGEEHSCGIRVEVHRRMLGCQRTSARPTVPHAGQFALGSR